MDSYDNEQANATMPDGMRRTIIPGLKLGNHTENAAEIARSIEDTTAETRRFTPTPLDKQALRSVHLPQTDTRPQTDVRPQADIRPQADVRPQMDIRPQADVKALELDKIVPPTPSRLPVREAVTGRELFAHVKDQDTMRRLALQAGNDLDEELANNAKWRDDLADLTLKQPLNPQVQRVDLKAASALTENTSDSAETSKQAVDQASQALAKAREDAFRLWESQTSSFHNEQEAAEQDTVKVPYVRDVEPANFDAYANTAVSEKEYPAINDYESSYPQEQYSPVRASNYATSESDYGNFNYQAEAEADNSERFQAYDNLMANPDQAAYAYQARQNPNYEELDYADTDFNTPKTANIEANEPTLLNRQAQVQEQSQPQAQATLQSQPQQNKYEAALSNDTGLIGSLLTSGQDLVNLLKSMFTNFPEEACRKISQAKSMAFVPAALIYFVLYLIYGSAHLMHGGLLTTALKGQDGITVWAALLVTIITAVCHIALYTLIFVLANYLSYYKRSLLAILNCVAALLILQACFIPLILLFSIFATPVVSILSTLRFAWIVLLTDKFVRQQGSPKFSKQADLVALIIASLVALMPTIISIFF